MRIGEIGGRLYEKAAQEHHKDLEEVPELRPQVEHHRAGGNGALCGFGRLEIVMAITWIAVLSAES